ncbi:MAG: IS3 family transposase [Gammaproteobacteria bacterium]|nr:IS3 family transposase [Gammaproteobacteria bacterium]
MIEPSGNSLSVRRQCELVSVNRSGIYHQSKGESAFNLALMRQMDEWMLDDPTLGVIGMVDQFKDQDLRVNPKRIRRLMRKMGLMAIYPKKHLSVLGEAKYIRPYLLRGLSVARPNQVWCVDITYIPMQKGFMYLTAIIDVYSRKIIAWGLSNSLSNECCLEVLDQAIAEYGKPEILNSDQGSQFTSKEWISRLEQEHIKISMDGKGRALDNIYIERFWRTLKQRYVYLNPAIDGLDLYGGIDTFMNKYNNKRHQGIGRIAPNVMYQMAA